MPNADKEQSTKSYLGDSVYAEFKGYAIILTTENGVPSDFDGLWHDPSNQIVLELEVLDALFRYASQHGFKFTP